MQGLNKRLYFESDILAPLIGATDFDESLEATVGIRPK
jgi:hypothetical protein